MSDEKRFPSRPTGVAGSVLGELDLFIGTQFDCASGVFRGGRLQPATLYALRTEDGRIREYFRGVVQAVSQYRFSVISVDRLLVAARYDDLITFAVCPYDERPDDDLLTEPRIAPSWNLHVFDRDGVCRAASYATSDEIAAKRRGRAVRSGARQEATDRRALVAERIEQERDRLTDIVVHLPRGDPHRAAGLEWLHADDFDLVSIQLLYELLDEKRQATNLLELDE
jgi:hypothetical protein